MFLNFTMSDLQQVKRSLLSTKTNLTYVLPHELSSDLRVTILGIQRVLENCKIFIVEYSLQKLERSSQKTWKSRYQMFLFQSNCNGFLFQFFCEGLWFSSNFFDVIQMLFNSTHREKILLNSIQEFIEIETQLLLIFFIFLRKQLSYMHSVVKY